MLLRRQDPRSRLGFDYEVARRLPSPVLESVRAYASTDQANRGSEVTPEQGLAGEATAYVVGYRFPILTGPDQYTDSAIVRFDLLAGGNYPYSPPAVQVISRPLPWSPHVHPASGIVCIGDGWRDARGHMLFAQLVVHVMHLLNCDEPDRSVLYSGFNAAAIRYWREKLGRKPLNPDLQYPLLPLDVAFGIQNPNASFAQSPVGCAFRPAVEAEGAQDFAFAIAADAGFKPLGTGTT